MKKIILFYKNFLAKKKKRKNKFEFEFKKELKSLRKLDIMFFFSGILNIN